MEARAKHKFQATADDELSFDKDVVLKITDTKQDKNWYKAELCGKEGFVPINYIEWRRPDWYNQNVGRSGAEDLLKEKDNISCVHPDGAFVVRNSESQLGEFSLSVKTGDDSVQHFKILRDGMGKYFLWVLKFDSINELVDYHREHSISRSQSIFLQDMCTTQAYVKCVALYDFVGRDDEISFMKGDIILKTGENCPNWWKGFKVGSSEEGPFPKAYVKVYESS